MDRHARSFPKFPDGELAEYGPLSAALSQRFKFDAHFTALSCPSIERRLGGPGMFEHRPRVVAAVFDVDVPGHARATPEWWAAERAKLERARADLGWCYAYATRGGCRAVWALAEPLELSSPRDALRWRLSYLGWVDHLRERYQICADPTCADATRLYRLPLVSRDGEDVEPLGTLGRVDRLAGWPLPLVAADDPRLDRQEEVLEVAEPAPVAPELLAEAALALSAAWPATGRHLAQRALAGALAKLGWSEDAVAEFIYAVVEHRYPGCGDLEKRRATARDTRNAVAGGRDVEGWHTLEARVDAGAVLAARRALGCGPDLDLFAAARAAAEPPTARQLLADARAAGDPAVAGAPDDDLYTGLVEEAYELIKPAFERASRASGRERKPDDARRMFSTMRDLLGRDVAPPAFLVDNLILSDGVGAVSGEPKSGKSWDLLHLCVSIASGTPAFAKFTVQHPERVAYFSVEDTEAAVKVRVLATAAGKGLPVGEWVDRLTVQPRGRELDVCSAFDMTVFVASLWYVEATVPGGPHRLVALDPLSDIHGKKEDSRDEMAVVMAHFRELRRILSERAGASVAVAFVHHSSKESADSKARKRGGSKMRGSSAIHGAIDWGVYAMAPEGDHETTFTCRMESEVKAARGGGVFKRTIKIEDDERGRARVARWECGEVTERAEGPTDLAEQRAAMITKILADHGAPLTRDALKLKLRARGASGSDALERAIEMAIEVGWIASKYRGKQSIGYEATELGWELVRAGGGGGGGRSDGDGPAAPPQRPPPTPGSALASVLGEVPRA
jgi:AAA domain